MRRALLSAAILSVLSSAPVLAQSGPPGMIMKLGDGCSGGTLVSPSTTPPTVGMTLPLLFANLPSTPGGLYVVIGFSRLTWAGFPLPFNLGMFGIYPDCYLHISPDIIVPWSNPGGFVTFPLGIPNDPYLYWLEFGVQGFAMDPAANPAGLRVTDSLWGTIGN